jgi:LytS/YehU family sensor histidine kinase
MFGTYLRQNLDSLDQPNLIPFRKELEHTQVYAEIEQIRFPSIRLEYDIADDDFSVPPLTVQPLVENAIRHGVRVRAQGLVEIATASDEKNHFITIRDNGKGFDPQADADPQQSHIGINNVRERIESMCGGSLHIDSQPDAGTTVTIRIPRGKETV